MSTARIRSQEMADDRVAENDDQKINPPPGGEKDWALVVDRIRQGVQSAMEELYAWFGKGVRYFLLRRLGSDELDDRVHDIFLVVAAAIRNGELRDPARLMGYVRTVVRRTIAGVIHENINSRVSYVDTDKDRKSV